MSEINVLGLLSSENLRYIMNLAICERDVMLVIRLNCHGHLASDIQKLCVNLFGIGNYRCCKN